LNGIIEKIIKLKSNYLIFVVAVLLISFAGIAAGWGYTASTGSGRVAPAEIQTALNVPPEEVQNLAKTGNLAFAFEYLQHSKAQCSKEVPGKETMYKQFDRTWGFISSLNWFNVVNRNGDVTLIRFNGPIETFNIPYTGCPAGWVESGKRLSVARERNLYVNGVKVPNTQ
jgi:hypothetical protein